MQTPNCVRVCVSSQFFSRMTIKREQDGTVLQLQSICSCRKRCHCLIWADSVIFVTLQWLSVTFQCVGTSCSITVSISWEIPQQRSMVKQNYQHDYLSCSDRRLTQMSSSIFYHTVIQECAVWWNSMENWMHKKCQQLPILVSLHEKLISTFHHFVVLCIADVCTFKISIMTSLILYKACLIWSS